MLLMKPSVIASTRAHVDADVDTKLDDDPVERTTQKEIQNNEVTKFKKKRETFQKLPLLFLLYVTLHI